MKQGGLLRLTSVAVLIGVLLAPAALAQQVAAARQVNAVTAALGAVTTGRTTSVTIEPSRDAQVAATVSGQVDRVLVREGGVVAAGQAVIKIDDASLRLQVENARIARDTASINLAAAERASGEGVDQARAALRAAEANLELARRQYEEARQLFELGAVAATELAGLEAQYAQAQSAAQQARDAVARSERVDGEELALRRLQVKQAENQLAQ
ncbi:MAG TPA: biotin/lipoyl-binding protein, partial [Trueperaceae bacterium]|nr:biotin/lipoyl-binding protein [Trueperaceae bacterium]